MSWPRSAVSSCARAQLAAARQTATRRHPCRCTPCVHVVCSLYSSRWHRRAWYCSRWTLLLPTFTVLREEQRPPGAAVEASTAADDRTHRDRHTERDRPTERDRDTQTDDQTTGSPVLGPLVVLLSLRSPQTASSPWSTGTQAERERERERERELISRLNGSLCAAVSGRCRGVADFAASFG